MVSSRLEKICWNLEFDRIVLVVFVGKYSQELFNFRYTRPYHGESIIIISSTNQYSRKLLSGWKGEPVKDWERNVCILFVSMLCNLMFFNRRIWSKFVFTITAFGHFLLWSGWIRHLATTLQIVDYAILEKLRDLLSSNSDRSCSKCSQKGRRWKCLHY